MEKGEGHENGSCFRSPGQASSAAWLTGESLARAKHVFLSVEGPARARHGMYVRSAKSAVLCEAAGLYLVAEGTVVQKNTVVRGPWDDAGVRQSLLLLRK